MAAQADHPVARLELRGARVVEAEYLVVPNHAYEQVAAHDVAATTGYGDVVPVSDGARLTTTLVFTPVRILFLILLVGTTVELLADDRPAGGRHGAGP